MIYYILNPEVPKEEQIKARVSKKFLKIAKKMATLARKHAELDLKLVEEFANCNDISADEASDIMATYDFYVDITQYGIGNCELNSKQITKREYLQLMKGNTNDRT